MTGPYGDDFQADDGYAVPEDKPTPRGKIVAAVGIAAALIIGGGVYLLVGGDDNSTTDAGGSSSAAQSTSASAAASSSSGERLGVPQTSANGSGAVGGSTGSGGAAGGDGSGGAGGGVSTGASPSPGAGDCTMATEAKTAGDFPAQDVTITCTSPKSVTVVPLTPATITVDGVEESAAQTMCVTGEWKFTVNEGTFEWTEGAAC